MVFGAFMLNWLSKKVEQIARPGSDEAYKLYASIAQAARQPEFYQRFEVEDSFDGRFDTLTLVAVLVAHRLKNCGEQGYAMSQSVTDVMFADMDLSLHEIGVSENKVSKKVKTIATAFMGRMQVYVDAIDRGDDAGLADALHRNLYRENGTDSIANGLVGMIKDEVKRLASLPDDQLLAGDGGVLFDCSGQSSV